MIWNKLPDDLLQYVYDFLPKFKLIYDSSLIDDKSDNKFIILIVKSIYKQQTERYIIVYDNEPNNQCVSIFSFEKNIGDCKYLDPLTIKSKNIINAFGITNNIRRTFFNTNTLNISTKYYTTPDYYKNNIYYFSLYNAGNDWYYNYKCPSCNNIPVCYKIHTRYNHVTISGDIFCIYCEISIDKSYWNKFKTLQNNASKHSKCLLKNNKKND